MVAGSAALDVIAEEKLCERAATTGELLGNTLKSVKAKFPQYVRDIRGIGMMWTIDLVAPEILAFVFPYMLRERHILIAPHLNRVDWLRVSPPLNVAPEDIAQICNAFEDALRAYDKLDDATREKYAYGVRQSLKKSIEEATLDDATPGAEARS